MNVKTNMANVFQTLIFVLNVSYLVTSSIIMATEAPGIYYIEELDEHKDAYTKVVSMRNGQRNKMSASEQLCHKAHSDCLLVVDSESLVCAQHRRYGLVNFPSLCEIRFQNCLIKYRETKSGKKNKFGNFYYNGRMRGCDHYMDQTKTVSQAVQLYIAEDRDNKIKTYKENEKPIRGKQFIVV